MSDQSVPPVVRAYFDVVNTRAWDRLPDLFTDDVELRPVGSPNRSGREDVAAYYPPLLSGFSSGRDEPVRFHVAGDVVTVEIEFTGTTVDGAPVRFDAADIFEIRDGRIARLSIFYDTRDVVRQVRAVAPSSS